MSALLTSEKAEVERIGFLIDECKRMGVEVLPPDINESFRYFSVVPKKNQVRFGLLAIKNVGSNVVDAIVQERKESGPFASIDDFVSRIQSKDLNKKSMESLVKAGVFDKLAERRQLLFNLEKILEWNRENKKIRSGGQRGLFDGTGITFNNEIHLKETEPATKKERLTWEKELLGLFVSANPLDDFKTILEKRSMRISELNYNFINHKVKIGGIISKIKKIITKTGKPMFFMQLEDLSDKIEIIVFPSAIEKNPAAFQENKIVFVSGKIDRRGGDTPKIICEDIEEIIES
jgi:DNA polymerase-3 subunit alpha